MKDAAVAAERFDATEVPVPPGEFALTVTSVKHYTDRLFKFCLTRLASFRFRQGEFAMIGLPRADRAVIIESGKQKYYGTLEDLNNQPEIRDAYLAA